MSYLRWTDWNEMKQEDVQCAREQLRLAKEVLNELSLPLDPMAILQLALVRVSIARAYADLAIAEAAERIPSSPVADPEDLGLIGLLLQIHKENKVRREQQETAQ
jgi:hypothetical protein